MLELENPNVDITVHFGQRPRTTLAGVKPSMRRVLWKETQRETKTGLYEKNAMSLHVVYTNVVCDQPAAAYVYYV